MREHARYGYGCGGSAGIEILERNDVFSGQKRVGFTGISIQRKTFRTGCFAHHHDENSMFGIVVGFELRILVQRHESLENE